jgi:hypothetical protein
MARLHPTKRTILVMILIMEVAISDRVASPIIAGIPQYAPKSKNATTSSLDDELSFLLPTTFPTGATIYPLKKLFLPIMRGFRI